MIQRNEEKGSALLFILLHRTRKGAPLKRRANHPILTFALLALGSAIAAFAVEEFLVPNTILDGGVIGIGIMVSYLTGLPLAALTILLNVPFVILGGLKLGRSFTVRAVFSMAVFSPAWSCTAGGQRPQTTPCSLFASEVSCWASVSASSSERAAVWTAPRLSLSYSAEGPTSP